MNFGLQRRRSRSVRESQSRTDHADEAGKTLAALVSLSPNQCLHEDYYLLDPSTLTGSSRG